MKLFRVYVDGALFYHPHLSKLSITEAKLAEDAEGVDSFMLSAPHDHPYLSRIQPMASEIVCKYGDATVFKGRALDIGMDFYNTHSWQCEAALAYLRDSQQPPFAYTGSLCGLLELFLNNHNSSVEARKQFVLGEVTVTDSNDYINRSASEYMDTMSAIKSKLLDTHGGYLRVRYESDGNYLDWLADFDVRSAQTVEFGKNLLDVKIEESHEDRVTALIPFGAKIMETDKDGNETETDQRVTIDSVNDGKNYVCDEKAVDEIGWIWTTEIWEDVTLPQNLLTRAKARINILSKGISSIEMSIVDESLTGADIDDIHARQYVVCKSPPHGLDDTFLCTGRTRDYLNASGNTITIGAERAGIASITAKQDPEKLVQNVKIELEEQISSIERKQLYRVEISTKGSYIFTDKGMAAVLSAHVYAWNTEITAKLDASCFAWHRSSSDEAADAEWDSYHAGMKSITVTTEDVQDNASFRCEVNIQE